MLMYSILAILLVRYYSVRAAEICCPDVGCFNDDPPFEEGVIPLPECITPTFLLYRGNLGSPVEITLGDTPPEFERGERTIFLLHGWQSSGDGWPTPAKDALISRERSANVIIVDWSTGASNTYYPQSASNARSAGAYVAEIVDQLNAAYSWCAGHSLGAHLCGYAGKRSNLDRITGLDPAGPFFQDTCGLNPSACRLHPNDANQVDVIHTDGKDQVNSYGTLIPMGDIDFYPNAGGLQPGCRDYANVAAHPEEESALGCSHGRAHEYFLESIDDDCFVVREKCTDHNDLPGSCSNQIGCPNMGYSTSSGDGLYNLETNDASPYCQN